MKRVVGVSVGSSRRDHQVQVEALGEEIILERRGTDGNIDKAIELIRELDGTVDAFGLGGIDLYIWAGKRRYVLREAKKIAAAAQITPIVDGSGLKNTLERNVVHHLRVTRPEILNGKAVLMVSAMDRFGMAESLLESGCQILYGDLIFALGLPIPIYRLAALQAVTRFLAPVVVQLPIKMIYPVGSNQDLATPNPRFRKYYQWADVIAGDFHMLNRHLPDDLAGKTVLTNTVTLDDVERLKQVGLSTLITTTPKLQGRSFGTNMIEALMVALLQKKVDEIKPDDYTQLLEAIKLEPRIEQLNPSRSLED